MIYIIGAGAIGQALAVMLKNSNKEVTLIRGSVDGEPETSKNIRVKLPDESELSAVIRVQTFNQFTQFDGPVVITAKSYGNDHIATKLAQLDKIGPVILLQNGLNIEQSFSERGFQQLYRCVLMVTSQFTDGGVIRFRPVSICPTGTVHGKQTALLALVGQLDNPWFRFSAETSIQPLIWKKAIVNCVFNSICPLLETDNGIFYRNAAALTIARRVIAEGVIVAGHGGVLLTAGEVEQTLLAISRSADGQFISTLQDIRNKRPTEIATLNQEIVNIAARYHLAELAPETRLLGELTAIKSQLNR